MQRKCLSLTDEAKSGPKTKNPKNIERPHHDEKAVSVRSTCTA